MKFDFRNLLIFGFALLLLFKQANAQKQLKIQYIELKDTLVTKAIKAYINTLSEESHVKYYLKLTICQFNNRRRASPNDTLFHYRISPVGLNTKTFENYPYPTFYTLIQDKLIEFRPEAINDAFTIDFKKRSMKKYFNILKNYIEDLHVYKEYLKGNPDILYPVTIFIKSLHIYKLSDRSIVIKVTHY